MDENIGFTFNYPKNWQVAVITTDNNPASLYRLTPNQRTECKTVNSAPACYAGIRFNIYEILIKINYSDFRKQKFTQFDTQEKDLSTTNIDGGTLYSFYYINSFDGQRFQDNWIKLDNNDFLLVTDEGLTNVELPILSEVVGSISFK